MSKNQFAPKNPTRKVITTNKDGCTTVCFFKEINGVLKYHNFNGPAKITTLNNKVKNEYFLFGVRHSEKEFKKLSKII